MELLNKDQLAEFLNVELKTVKYLLYFNKIPKVKVGKEYRFIKEEIEKWLQVKSEHPREYDFSHLFNSTQSDYQKQSYEK